MKPEDYNWQIDLVKERNYALDLTFEQAEEVYKYEQNKSIESAKHYFSVWEEWDYEETVFREILNTEQFNHYIQLSKENRLAYELSLVEHDNEKTNEFLYHEELMTFYQQEFLPELFKDRFIQFLWIRTEQNKVEYLRLEYKRFLNEIKKEILINHFRQNRTFKPNELKLSLLRHKLLSIFPDYRYFKGQMDKPTKSVVKYLKSKVKNLPGEIEQLMKRKFKELEDFNANNFKKHYGEVQGWHVVIGHTSEEEAKENHFMTLLLLEPDR